MEVVGENDFGNLMIRDIQGQYWRLRPEDLSCEIVALNQEELESLSADQEFLHDWNMQALVKQAHERLGPLIEDRKYCLALPGLLGGEYSSSNMETIPLNELIRFSGDLAKQVKDLPDGAKIELKVVN